MIRFVPVKSDAVKQLSVIADHIWHEYWPALIGSAQTDYMVERFQSEEAIARDVAEHDYEYWFIAVQEEESPIALTQAAGRPGIQTEGDTNPSTPQAALETAADADMAPDAVAAARDLPEGRVVGYTGGHVEPETGRFFISKIYLFKDARGHGYASRVIDFYDRLCRDRGLTAMYLTVNKGNSLAIPAYEHLGFETIDAVETDIGEGFIMDDYIMEKKA